MNSKRNRQDAKNAKVPERNRQDAKNAKGPERNRQDAKVAKGPERNRQDAKNAKEIESLEKSVIDTSMGYELHESTGLTEGRPKRHAPSCVASRQWLPISPIEIEIEIGIDPCPAWHLALMERSNFAAALCQHHNHTVAGPDVSCLNPIRYRDRKRARSCFAIDLFGRALAQVMSHPNVSPFSPPLVFLASWRLNPFPPLAFLASWRLNPLPTLGVLGVLAVESLPSLGVLGG